jgi:plastocyanin
MAPDATAMPDTMMPEIPPEAMAIFETAPADLLTVSLNQDNDSGQDGWANLTAKGDQTEVILLLPPGDLETELAHIHSGRCGEETLGEVVHPLTSFVDGAGFSVSTLDVTMSNLLTGDFAINTHSSDDPGVYTSCGNIPVDSESVTLALEAQNDSGQSGLATLTARGTMTEIVAFLSPGPMESELIHIHSGQCGDDTLGEVVHDLTSFVGGFGPTVSTVDAPLNSVQTGNFAINSHQTGDPSVYTACGNIGRNPDTITVNLDEDNESGQSGAAWLTPRGENTEVWVSLSEGSLESSAVHIHSGQCGEDLGGVVHPLTDLDQGTSATLLEGVSLSSLLTGDFAVNSHSAEDSSVYTACGNVPGTDVTMIATGGIASAFSFDVGEIVVPVGQTVTLSLSNQGESQHNIFFSEFDDQNAGDERADRLNPGEARTRQFVFDQPGIFSFYCPVGSGSHLNRGQIGVLRVVGPPPADEPTITLAAPAAEITGPSAIYAASVTNYDVSETSGDGGKVRIILDGADLGFAASTVGAVTNLAQGMYELTAELLDSSNMSLDPPVQNTISFTVDEETETPAGDPALGESPIAERSTVVVEAAE